MQAIPAVLGTVIVSVEYDGTGLAWARMYDNPVIGWTVDETGVEEPKPILIGQLPLVPAATAPILSPQWAQLTDSPTTNPAIFVPDLWRGNPSDFFTWLATNNGAARPLAARFGVSLAMKTAFDTWARLNPTLVYTE